MVQSYFAKIKGLPLCPRRDPPTQDPSCQQGEQRKQQASACGPTESWTGICHLQYLSWSLVPATKMMQALVDI
jgi:hypothetical protein